MELVKLGKKGQVTIPRSILKAIGIADGAPMVVDTTADGAIVLRQAAVYPIEIYSDARVEEFENSNSVPPALEARVDAFIRKKRKR